MSLHAGLLLHRYVACRRDREAFGEISNSLAALSQDRWTGVVAYALRTASEETAWRPKL